MADKHVRGPVVKGYFKFIERFWGKEALDQFLELSGIDLATISDIGWYDIKVLQSIHKHIAETRGLRHIKMIGNYTVKDLGVLAYLVRFSDIWSLLNKAPKSYSMAYDFGKVKVERITSGALITFKDVAFDEYSCLGWEGAFEGMLEITHTIGTVNEISCQGRGDPYCIFEIKWK